MSYFPTININANMPDTVTGKLLHKVSADTTTWSNSTSQWAFADNVNSAGSTTNVNMYIRALSIRRLGPLVTQPVLKYQTGGATSILKYTGGNLHSVVLGNNAGSVTLYDGLSTNAPIITFISSNNNISMDYKGLPFHNGLTCVTSGNCQATIIYE